MVDKKELLIMSALRSNARETLTKMSRKTRIPISTIYDKIRNHESKIIKKHTCILDFARLGFMTRATILIATRKNNKEEVMEHLRKHQNVNSVFKVNNGFDFLVETIFRQIKDLEEFIENIEDKYKIKKHQVYYIIDELKREEFLANPEMIDLLQIEA